MAPRDPFRLLRWNFVPELSAIDGSVRWRWRGYSQTGDQVLVSQRSFETLTECMDDAKRHGYGEV